MKALRKIKRAGQILGTVRDLAKPGDVQRLSKEKGLGVVLVSVALIVLFRLVLGWELTSEDLATFVAIVSGLTGVYQVVARHRADREASDPFFRIRSGRFPK